MAHFTIELDTRKKADKGLLAYLSSLGVLVEKKEKSILDEALEDIKSGKVHSISRKDFSKMILG